MDAELIVYSRAGCHLCDELLAELASMTAGGPVRVRVVDVDSDPVMRRRYGFDVPVVLADGEVLCRHRLDAGAVAEWLQRLRFAE